MNPLDAVSDSLLPWEAETILHGYCGGLPFLRRGFAPIGGDLGTRDEDFIVSEIPAYEPCGSGEHVYLWVEKKGHPTQDVIRLIQRIFHVGEAAIGCAGKKDAHAITRQWMSIQTHIGDEQVLDCVNQMQESSWIKVLRQTRHTNKLRMGHLKGNRFSVVLNGVQAGDEEIQVACDDLGRHGFINYFGIQRFGQDRENIANGLKILNGGNARHHQKQIYISAVQSALFNLMAARRFYEHGTEVFSGDVLKKLGGGCFVCEDPGIDNERAKNGEIGITLPLVGKKVMHGHGFSEELENRVWADFKAFWQNQLSPEDIDFERLHSIVDGDRRLMCIRPENLCFKRLNNSVISMEFSLPSGCYATVLLHHICGQTFSR